MYPRNAASPESIAIGPVVQISDGAVQSSGVTVRVLPFGGSEADGGGTTAYSTDGVVVYTPTQAETNYTSFVLIAKKTGCIPASVTVVTSESSVSGRVYVQTNGDKTGYTASVSDKTGFSLLANTGLGNQTANITGNLSGSVGSVTGSVGSVTSPVAVSDKTGFKLASDGLALVASWSVNITGNITGNLTGSIGSISGVTLPAVVASQPSVDTLTEYVDTEVAAIKAKTDNLPASPAAVSDIPTVSQIADAVLEESVDAHAGVAQSLAKYISIIKKANTVVEGTVLASPTPTTTVFRCALNYPTGAFEHSVLFFDENASVAEQNSPIVTWVNNGDGTSTITLEEPTTSAPVAGDMFYIVPSSHVHAITDIQNGLATSAALSAVATNVTALVTRVPATLFSGITYMSRWLGSIAGKTADSTTRAEINATPGGASYNETTDSLEAIRDRGDAAWTSGGGSGGVTNIQVEDRSITLE